MAGNWPSPFFCVLMDRDGVDVRKLASKRTRQILSHLDRTSLVNKGFIREFKKLLRRRQRLRRLKNEFIFYLRISRYS